MTISYSVSSVITNVGITAALNAGTEGPQINIDGFQIGSQSALEGSVATVNDISVDGFVYQGTLAQMSYTVLDMDTVKWTILLDTTVGNFEVGNIGIILAGNVLFAKAVLPGQSPKYTSNPPTTVGNTKTYNIIMRLANIANLLNLTILMSDTASLPEVPTELVLPNALMSPFNCYMVDNHTHIGVPTTALRLNGNWYHAPHRLYPAQGSGVLACSPSQFDVGVAVGQAVYMNGASSTFSASDAAILAELPYGVRSSTFEVTVLGQVPGTMLGLSGALIPGTRYYVGSASTSNLGIINSYALGPCIGVAVSTTDVFVDFSAGSVLTFSLATTTSYGISREATLTEQTAGVTTGPAPAFVTPEGLPLFLAANLPVASTTQRGIAREATSTEASEGTTLGSVPAFITPEEMAAYLSGVGDPFTTTGIGALMFGLWTFKVPSQPTVVSTVYPMTGGYAAPITVPQSGNPPTAGDTVTFLQYNELSYGGAAALSIVASNDGNIWLPMNCLRLTAGLVTDLGAYPIAATSFDARWPLPSYNNSQSTAGIFPVLPIPVGTWVVISVYPTLLLNRIA